MSVNKYIERRNQTATKIFNNRSLTVDYRTLAPIIRKGISVLDVGCGTGAISKDIAQRVGPAGQVIGIDNTLSIIESGKACFGDVENLQLIHSDIFNFSPTKKFDLIVAARVLQWLSNPVKALLKMKSLLNPSGQISILDYNHSALEWSPEPPKSMKVFYQTFLKWREDAGMNNRIAEDLPHMMKAAGLCAIEKINSNEHYERTRPDFKSKVGIWAKVAGSTQMVDEGYLDNDLRLRAIEDYTNWVDKDAVSMTMKLNEVRGRLNV